MAFLLLITENFTCSLASEIPIESRLPLAKGNHSRGSVSKSSKYMDKITTTFKKACQNYNGRRVFHQECYEIVKLCLTKLRDESTIRYFGDYPGDPRVPYRIAEYGSEISRPVREEMFLWEIDSYEKGYDDLLEKLKQGILIAESDLVLANNIIYTSVMSFALCIDLWKRGSRKTPGTFFEIFMAALFGIFMPKARLSKHVKLNDGFSDKEGDEDDKDEEVWESVATDLVISSSHTTQSVVIPFKITTRERIVQPFAHQRILDSALPGKYQSLLACVSETQLSHRKTAINQICVPGTIKLFQKHLANLQGIYYCDVPQRYTKADITKIIPVKTIGHIFDDTKALLSYTT